MKHIKEIQKLDISYYETSWETVCVELEEKINEIIEVINKLNKEQ